MARGEREALPARWGGYVLVKRLAVGGMAEVYLAVDEPPLGGRRFVVIKRVREDYVDLPEYAQFFLTEGRVSLKVHHPNLPFAHRLGEADGRAFLVLEYIHGHSLIQVLRAVVTARRGLTVGGAVVIGLAVARALEHLHGLTDLDGTPLDVIHRDVSPHNLIIGDNGVVKLIDLGVARAALQTHRTETGVVKGKYAYMAPEQLGPVAQLDARADLFSLGAVLHELLVGRALFQGQSDLDTCDRVRLLPIPDPHATRGDIPRGIADVVMTALERDPEHRWPSAAALVVALENAATGAGVWPSESGLAAETNALLGPAPRPVLEHHGLVWRDAPPALPRMWGGARGPGTVMETGQPTPPTPSATPEPIDDEPTEGVAAPIAEPEPARRDPALSYYLHVGAVKPSDEEPEK